MGKLFEGKDKKIYSYLLISGNLQIYVRNRKKRKKAKEARKAMMTAWKASK